MSNRIILKRHKLGYIGDLRVNDNILQSKFATGCSMAGCNAVCCKGGVWLDPGERDNILAHAPLVQRYMDAGQEHRPEYWFDNEVFTDTDFPSGKAVATHSNEKGCVFLKADGKCVLQTAAIAEGMNAFALKPFYCVAYPITIEHGELMVDDLEFGYRPECCSTVNNGTQSVFAVCNDELGFVLGEEGLKELRVHSENGGT